MSHTTEHTTQIIKTDESTSDVVSLRKCQLLVLEGEDKGKKMVLNKPSTKLGKREGNDFLLSDKTVSRNHLEIEYTSDSFLLRDLNSTNGTYLNGNRVKEAYLAPGDVIKLGNTSIEFQAFSETVKIEPSSQESFGGMVGKSRKMQDIFSTVDSIAGTTSTVLILGESGTGKELVARALHAASQRRSRPFVEVNCAAIPEELIESELFGHVRGSFTGASADKVGKFQKADSGTLFLDEIGDMSLKTQSKVLRVLEEQSFEPVGSNLAATVDVRVIAATNKKLEDEIARGVFREDLFYRLNVIPFYVPALRERTEDLPILARYFLAEFCGAYGRKPKELGEAALGVFVRYPWPGNVRELRNLIERLVIVCPHERIEPHHLPPELFRGAARSPQQPYATLHEARAAYEREFILRKLEENQWNMTHTATALGLERSHLYRKMKALGIPPAEAERVSE